MADNGGKEEKRENTNHRYGCEQPGVSQKVSYGRTHQVDVGEQHEAFMDEGAAPEPKSADDEQSKREQVAEIENRGGLGVQLLADALIPAEIEAAPDHGYRDRIAKRNKDQKRKCRSETDPSMPRDTPGLH